LNHSLLHGGHDTTWLLNVSSHVHRWHTGGVALQHLLLSGLVILTISSSRVILTLVGTTWLSVDDGWLTIHRVTHLTWHADLLDHTTIHWSSLGRIRGHGHLLWVHELLLVLSLILVHASLATHWSALGLRTGLTEFMHAMSVCAVV